MLTKVFFVSILIFVAAN